MKSVLKYALVLFVSLMAVVGGATTPDQSAAALIQRLIPGKAGKFVCEVFPAEGGRDVFEIE